MEAVINVSIIIPVYNTAAKLRRCLDSVLAQDYDHYECIMIDDGSKDESGEIIDEYAQHNDRFIAIHKKNGGVSSARNKGLEIARGEWLVFVDSDDYLLPDHLSSMLEFADDNIDMVLTGFRFLHPDNITEHIYSDGIYCNQKELSNFIIHSDFLDWQIPWDRMYRNKRNIRFDEKLSISEDRLFCYQYLLVCKGIATIKKITYIHDGTDESSLSYKIYPSNVNRYRYKMFKNVTKQLLSTYNIERFKIESYQAYLYSDLHASFVREGKFIRRFFFSVLHKLNLL